MSAVQEAASTPGVFPTAIPRSLAAATSIWLTQGLEGVLRDPGFGRNRARDSGIQKKSSRDS